MAEIETFIFQRAQVRRQVGEGIVIKVRALQAFTVDVDQIELRAGDRFGRFFVVSREIRIAVARLGFHQLGDLMERRAGVDGGQRQEQRQQAIAMMVRVMATSAQHPGQRAKNRHQRGDKA